jgi:hypothetical protein
MLDSKKSKLSIYIRHAFKKNHFLVRNLMVKLEEKIEKMTKFKANFRPVKVNNSVQIIPIYKLGPLSLKICAILYVK